MNKPRDLGILLEMAERRRDEAAQALARARQERQSADAQMAQLQAYTQDAEARWHQRALVGVSPTLLATHRQFMAKLEDAITYQTQTLRQLDERIAQREAQLREAERALATLERVQQRWQQDWHQHLRRLEQKANDEMAATLHRRRQLPHS
ncbi:MAG: flagellar export protein FliJ [Tepidimonas sp.]|uniref:flagellar export protein FliJ n=1 Tax=Tepidimonas sp. TaxID=2002775 RepID=UPI00259E187D|nr:flagellar export protein FliJ [Tepidimonas sp.]MDM7456959.1 flagellar export protein FliJ [Tepidimonas sp.]